MLLQGTYPTFADGHRWPIVFLRNHCTIEWQSSPLE